MPQETRTRMIHARIDPKLKKSTERIFSELGITTTEAIRIFLRQVELHRGLPFAIAIPNAETVTAMTEANHPSSLKRYRSFHELRKRI